MPQDPEGLEGFIGRSDLSQDVAAELERVVAESPQLLPAFSDLVSAESVRGLKEILNAHSELLTLDAVTLARTLVGVAPPEFTEIFAFAAQVVERVGLLGIQVGLADLRVDATELPDALPPALRVMLGRAFVLLADCRNDGDVAALDAALDIWESVMEDRAWQDVPEKMRLALEGDAAGFQLERYQAAGDKNDLLGAVDRLAGAVHAGCSDPSVTQNLMLAFRLTFQRFGRVEHLERALELARANDSPTDVGLALLQRHLATGNVSDLDDAIAAFERSRSASDLAHALRVRYEVTGSLADLEQAIAWGWASVDEAGAGVTSRASSLNNLGVALHCRYEETNSEADLIAAVDTLRAAVDATPAGAPVEPGHRSNLGGVLLERWRIRREIDDLLESIDCDRRAIDMSEGGVPDRPLWLHNLGVGLRELSELLTNERAAGAVRALEDALGEPGPNERRSAGYLTTGGASVLDEAIEALERAVEESGPDGILRPRSLLSLGQALRARYALSGNQDDIVRATLAFRDASALADDQWPSVGLASARALTDVCIETGVWMYARLAAEKAVAAARRLYETQLERTQKEAWLRRMQGLPASAAFATAALGDPERAAVLLDQGRALIVSEALEADASRLDRLVDAGRSDLRNRYAAAASRLQKLRERRGPQVGGAAALAQAQAELDDARTAIKSVRGYEHFLDPVAADDLAETARDQPLWYVLSTAAGGLALVVGDDAVVTPIVLPDLRDAELTRRLQRHFSAYEARDQDLATWNSALDEITGWLGEVLLGPLLAARPRTLRARVVPAGRLGFLPLHAAWTSDTETPTGRRYALDHVVLTYAPNARVARAARDRASRLNGERLLAVADPQPVTASPLETASEEVARIAARFGFAQRLEREVATRSTVLGVLDDFDVLHFACHGAASPTDPLATALILADNEPLALADIIGRRLAGVRLAVLSACETAMIGPDLPDEMTALPAGLLQAGAAGVVAPLWSVPDVATTVLMTRFYELWRDDNLTPPAALRGAQQWVRDVTRGELRQRFPEIKALSGARVPLAARELWSRTRPFAAPHYWASFSYVGA